MSKKPNENHTVPFRNRPVRDLVTAAQTTGQTSRSLLLLDLKKVYLTNTCTQHFTGGSMCISVLWVERKIQNRCGTEGCDHLFLRVFWLICIKIALKNEKE